MATRVGPSNVDPAIAAAGGYGGAPAPAQWSSVDPNKTAPQRDLDLMSQLMRSYDTSQPRTAPQATAAQAAGASQAGYQAAGSGGTSSYTPYSSEQAPGAQQATYSPYSAASAPAAAQVDMTRLGQANLVAAPNIDLATADFVDVPWAERAPDVQVGYTASAGAGQTQMPEWIPWSYAAAPMDAQAAHIGELQKAYAGQVGQASTGDSDALRARQMQLLDYLEGSAKGTNGPSAAEMQFQRNLDKSIAAQHAMAANARGTGRVTANLQAGYNVGELSQDANAQSAMLRAQEQQQARAQLLSGLESTRGQDLTVAGLQQQVNIANANLETATSQFNAGQINAAQLQQAQLQQQTTLANLQKASSFSQFNASQEQNMNQFRQDIQARVGMSNAGLTTQAGIASMQKDAARAAQQAQLSSQTGMFNAGEENTNQRLQSQMESTRGMFNAGQTNQVNTAQAGMKLQAGTFNAGAQNAFRQQQAGLNSSERLFNTGQQNQVNMFNTGQANQVGMFNTGQQADTSRFNAGQTNSVNMFNTGQANQVGLANAQNTLQNSQFNIGQTNQLGMFNAGQFNNNSQFNTGQSNQVNVANAGLQNQVNIQNSDAQLRQRALDDAQKQALMNQYLSATQLQQNAAQWEGQYALNRRAQTMGLIGGLIGAGGQVGAAFAGAPPTSDRAAKTDVKPLYSDERGKTDKAKLLDSYDSKGGEDEVAQLLDNLVPYKYRYKNTAEPGTAPGERYGIMAQDLEKSPMGASIVIEDGGRKKIDPGQAVGVLLAAMSRMNQRLKKAEKR
jgi:hypothetical protein